jgi:hypothetical protein
MRCLTRKLAIGWHLDGIHGWFSVDDRAVLDPLGPGRFSATHGSIGEHHLDAVADLEPGVESDAPGESDAEPKPNRRWKRPHRTAHAAAAVALSTEPRIEAA